MTYKGWNCANCTQTWTKDSRVVLHPEYHQEELWIRKEHFFPEQFAVQDDCSGHPFQWNNIPPHPQCSRPIVQVFGDVRTISQLLITPLRWCTSQGHTEVEVLEFKACSCVWPLCMGPKGGGNGTPCTSPPHTHINANHSMTLNEHISLYRSRMKRTRWID